MEKLWKSYGNVAENSMSIEIILGYLRSYGNIMENSSSIKAILGHLWADCLLAKVDGPGEIDLPQIFGNIRPPVFIYLHIFEHLYIY